MSSCFQTNWTHACSVPYSHDLHRCIRVAHPRDGSAESKSTISQISLRPTYCLVFNYCIGGGNATLGRPEPLPSMPFFFLALASASRSDVEASGSCAVNFGLVFKHFHIDLTWIQSGHNVELEIRIESCESPSKELILRRRRKSANTNA